MSKGNLDIDHIQLNLNVRGLEPSSTLSINDRGNELQGWGYDVFKLGLGQSPFPVPEPVVSALRDNAGQKDYLPVKGLVELREAVAAHHRRTYGIECNVEDVLIGPGSKLLMFLMQMCYYGDLVIPTPSWVSYAPQAEVIGRHIFTLPTSRETDWLPTAEQLEEFCSRDRGRPRILVLNYPSNPTGRTFSHEQLVDLATVAAENKVIILSDEIYGKLHHDGTHESIVHLCPEDSIFSGGLSKWCGAGGWRLGVFVFPKKLHWLLDAMAAVGTETFTATSAPIQYAAIRAFEEGPEIELYLEHSRRILKALGGFLAELLLRAGVRVLPPQGGFYLFPDFSAFRERFHFAGITTSAQMCSRLFEETGVALLPGSDFGRPPEEFTARLAYVDFDGAEALAASGGIPTDRDLDINFVQTYCGRTVEAVDRLCGWLAAPSNHRPAQFLTEEIS
ncbi:MAG: pyridoxal phosphate-dependent aminotransferase [Candidatus Krumholzibacteriia bacterium]